MTRYEVNSVLSTRKVDDRENGYHMMATTAYHLLGDISSDKPNLCFIYSETDNYYVGQWVEGIGCFNVLFPKESTRALTAKEHDHYNGKILRIGSHNPINFKIIPKP